MSWSAQRLSASRRAGHDLSALSCWATHPCSTPLGITARGTGLGAAPRAPPGLVLNASRHHGEGDWPTSRSIRAPTCAQRLSASRRGGPWQSSAGRLRSWCAQRLLASRRGGLEHDGEVGILPLVLNTSRHHGYYGGRRCRRLRPARPPCAQRLSASWRGEPSSAASRRTRPRGAQRLTASRRGGPRWHEDDLQGRLCSSLTARGPGFTTIIRL